MGAIKDIQAIEQASICWCWHCTDVWASQTPYKGKQKTHSKRSIEFFLLRTCISWQRPLTERHSRELSESGIRAVQCYDCPTAHRGSGHDTRKEALNDHLCHLHHGLGSIWINQSFKQWAHITTETHAARGILMVCMLSTSLRRLASAASSHRQHLHFFLLSFQCGSSVPARVCCVFMLEFIGYLGRSSSICPQKNTDALWCSMPQPILLHATPYS